MEREDRENQTSRGEGLDEERDPGVPMFEGQGQEDFHFTSRPVVPMFEGQGHNELNLTNDSRRANRPGEPRFEGQGQGELMIPRRATGRLERRQIEDPGESTRNNRHGSGLRMREREHRESRPRKRTRAYSESEDTDDYREYRRKKSRSSRRRPALSQRKRRLTPSSDSDEPRLPPSDQRPRDNVRNKELDTNIPGKTSDTNEMLDKFLSILQAVKSSDKPKLSFNNNVIPEFDPISKEQTILTWLTKVEECAEIYGWEDKEIIHYALPKLTGVAKTWYQGLPTMLHTWAEWKKKLLSSFPCREDYAELLTEMLAKRVKYGESLDQYYYAKVNLLNRCKIYGKQAVDCILYGVEDRAVKVGAQAAQFIEPEQVLKYFKTVKVGQVRDNNESSSKFKSDRRNTSFLNKPSGSRTGPTSNNNIRCYNCNEIGHPSFKCEKPLIKCTTCERLGHLSSHCFKNKLIKDQDQSKDSKTEKHVSQLNVEDSSNSKYVFDIMINSHKVLCHLDLGSQCSLITKSKVDELKLEVTVPDDLPILRGIGANLVPPIGMTTATVEVQGVKETISVYVVEDHVINQPVLLGHSFTEKPDIVITKTPKEVIVTRIPSAKIRLEVKKAVEIPSNTLRPVQFNSSTVLDGSVYVDGSVRGPEGKEYMLLPGEYEIKKGYGVLLIYNISPDTITMIDGFLLTRAYYKKMTQSLHVLDSYSVSFSETKSDEAVTFNTKLEGDERLLLQQLLSKYNDCFSNGLKDLGFTDVTDMEIELEDSEPVVYRPYRMSFAERSLVRGMVQEMIESGIVRESSSPYASPIVLVQKKTGEKRLCVDYRALNRKTKKDHYPLPRVEDQLDLLAGNTVFTSLDLASGYYQIPMAEESRHKTAFVTPDGQYEYNRMPFGLVNAPSVFQRTINKILLEAKIKYAIVYMDDVLIPAKNVAEGLQRLEEVLQLLKKGGLTLKMSKCNFLINTIDFLGFEVSAEGIRPGSRKTIAVSNFAKPTNQHEVRQFLGLSGFFRRFIKDYAIITAPLTDLLKKETKWSWDDSQDCAFNKVKALLVNRPLLALYDPKAETQLHTDASKDGLAGILLQRNSTGTFQPISYFSRKTTADERKFHSYELETLAVIASLNRFRVYLIGMPFKILTDCNALRSTLTKRDLIPRIARWWVQMQEYDLTIEYRPGPRMSHVDALSRNPVESSIPETHVLDVLAIQDSDQNWITTVQSADEEVKRIKDILNDPESAQVLDIHKNYKLKNDRVYRIIGDEIKWLVPKGVRWQILKMNHDDVGHCGFEKTLQRIQKNYWFAKLRRFVKKYVASCLECAHHKVPGGKHEGELHPIEKPCIPFHTIHADHLGPFIKSKRGNTYLLVLVDGFTKFVNINPVRNTKSVTTVKALQEHISYFGVPTRLITDKGSSFTSKTFKDFVKSNGIKHIINAVATPRANGQVERFNRTILDALSTSTHGKDEKSWDECIADIQVGLNTTTHKTTQKSPSELLFGFNVKCRSEGILNTIFDDTAVATSPEILSDIRNEAGEKIRQQQEKDRERFNKHRKPAKHYAEGDLVRVQRQVPHDGKSQKLVVKYQGPYRIIKVLPNDRYVVEDTPISRKHGRRYESIVAVDKIQPWLSFNRDLESSAEENDSSGEGE